MPHAQLMPRRFAQVGLGDAQADQLLAQAQADLTIALPIWQLIGQMMQNAINDPNTGGAVDPGYASFLKDVSMWACSASSFAVQAAQRYAKRCSAAAQAASGARQCPGLDISNEQAQGTPWGVVWNGRVNMLDPNLVPQVGAQVSQAQASIAAAQAARSAACPTASPVYIQPVHMRAPRITTPPPVLLAGVPRAGLGDITQTQQYQDAVSTLTNQLTLEGQSSFDIQGSIDSLGSTFQTLNQQMGSPTDALTAALNYTLGTKSFGAAADMVTGLLSAAESGAPPAALLQTFTGTMVGIMVLAGGISAGVGAAIVGAVAALVGILQALGLFGGAPAGTQLPGCPGTSYTGQGPDYQLPLPPPYGSTTSNPVYAWPDPYWQVSGNGKAGNQPGSPNWRHFPSAQLTAAGWMGLIGPDTWWFTSVVQGNSGGVMSYPVSQQWQPANNNKPMTLFFCYPSSGTPVAYGYRYIDAAFPLYHQMECETSIGESMFTQLVGGPNVEVIQALTSFNAAFFTALKLNWEYALNGIKPPASDIEVLVHTLYTWNRAHDSGQGWDITPDASSQPWMADGSACSGRPPWYAAILASNIGSTTLPDCSPTRGPGCVLSPSGNNKLHVNTGAKKPYSLSSQGIHLVGPIGVKGGFPGGGAPAPASSTFSNVMLGAATAIGITAGGLAIYSYATKQSYVGVLKSLWGSTKSGAKAGVSKVKGVFKR